jgi:hypothetical protein
MRHRIAMRACGAIDTLADIRGEAFRVQAS